MMKKENRIALLSALLGAGLFYLLDLRALDVNIAPLVSIIYLFALSLIFRPAGIAVVLLVLIPYVFISLIQSPGFDFGQSLSVQRLGVRMGSFTAAGLLALLASYFRTRAQTMLQQTSSLLEALPVPIVLSEPGGRIVWCNAAAQRLCGTAPLPGRKYTEALPFDGRPIHYDALFEEPTGAGELEHAVPGHLLKFIFLPTTGRRLLATVILKKSDPDTANPVAKHEPER